MERQITQLQPPLEPRRGKVLQVLGIARISRVTQNEKSLDDQDAFYREFLLRATNLEFEIQVLAGIGSGESLERKEYIQAWDEVESEKYDLVICEDLGRLARRVHAQLFCEHAIDHGTRVIAINDQLDTANENWTQIAGLSAIRHSMYNADTAKRIRRSHRNRFKNGEMIHLFSWGYIVPVGANYDHEISVDPVAVLIIHQIFLYLEEGWSYALLADWLNEQKVPVPKYCRVGKWTAGNVAQFVHNPILKGLRVRNTRMCVRVNKTGKRKSVRAPDSERLERFCPNLVIIEPARFDRVIRMLDARNGKCRRPLVNGVDPLANVPRKRTVWPGQHLVCGICGRLLHYGAHGLMRNLICSGVREYECWNAISINGLMAQDKLIQAIGEAIASLPDFESALVSDLTKAIEEFASQQNQRLVEERASLAKLERQVVHVVEAIRQCGISEALKAELKSTESEIAVCKETIEQLMIRLPETPALPHMSEIKTLALDSLRGLAAKSEELGLLLRKWIPVIHVMPFQLLQHGQPVQRAYFTLDLTSLLPSKAFHQKFGPMLQKHMVVDLFEMPARERLRTQIVQLKREGLYLRDIVARLQTHLPTVQFALKLQEEMDSLGITDPVLPILEPPDNCKKWRRHRHPRFVFKPLPGFPLRFGD